MNVSEVLALGSVQRADGRRNEAALRRHVADVWFPAVWIPPRAGSCARSIGAGARGSSRSGCSSSRRARLAPAAALAWAYPKQSRWADYAVAGFTYLRDVMWIIASGSWFRRVAR